METPIQNILVGLMQPFAYEAITVGASAVGFTSGTHTPSSGRKAVKAIVTVEDAPIRYRYDGTDPTASEGHQLNPMQSIVVVGYEAISNIKFIRKGSNSGKIRVTYER